MAPNDLETRAEAASPPPPPGEPGAALDHLLGFANSARALEFAAYHKTPRRYLGLAGPDLDAAVAGWRATLDPPARLTLAAHFWDSDIHEARIAAAKLLTQARLGAHDGLVWAEFLRWLPDFDALAIADQACKAAERRLAADPGRLDVVETWLTHANPWIRRAALMASLPWTRQNHPDAHEAAIRDRLLGWAARLAPDRDWFVQKALGLWLGTLAIHDPDRVRAFLDGPGKRLRPATRREAARRLA